MAHILQGNGCRPQRNIGRGFCDYYLREDGKKQTTFRGYPLYYWINGKQPGETTGQGVNSLWFVINPDSFISK
jgi:predicted lipoprotein with Yx(FWY)xxD motif